MEAVRPSLETSEADEVLLARVASGDQAAFEKLFLSYQKRLFRYLLGAVRADTIRGGPFEAGMTYSVMYEKNEPHSKGGMPGARYRKRPARNRGVTQRPADVRPLHQPYGTRKGGGNR